MKALCLAIVMKCRRSRRWRVVIKAGFHKSPGDCIETTRSAIYADSTKDWRPSGFDIGIICGVQVKQWDEKTLQTFIVDVIFRQLWVLRSMLQNLLAKLHNLGPAEIYSSKNKYCLTPSISNQFLSFSFHDFAETNKEERG
mmetsp:Transcript_13390/g.27517  ORF Transcript_13390/g.27517 Transcript_13390/m.27517 type:complete len:141 (+) Transcript_13390:2780-3202(+)